MAFSVKASWITRCRRIVVAGILLFFGLFVSQAIDNILSTPSYFQYPGGFPEYHIQNYEICDNQIGNKSEAPDHKVISRTKNFPNILLLSSIGRSGSSFMGGLLTSPPGVFYYFEPLYNLEQWNMLTRPLAVESLKKLFMCNFTGSIFTAIKTRGKNCFRHPYIRRCGSKHSCLNADRLTRVCSKEPIRMVKTIRTRVSWLIPLLEDLDVNLRVIHILRDPRGSIISNWKAGWNVKAEDRCNNILEDMESGRHLQQYYPNRYLAVRYEDMCADPRGIATAVLRFLGYVNLFPSTIRFLDKMTSRDDGGDEYSLRRNTSYQQQKWRKVITEKELLKVEAACSKSIISLGFNLFQNINTTRNLDIPLYNASHVNSMFTYKNCINV